MGRCLAGHIRRRGRYLCGCVREWFLVAILKRELWLTFSVLRQSIRDRKTRSTSSNDDIVIRLIQWCFEVYSGNTSSCKSAKHQLNE